MTASHVSADRHARGLYWERAWNLVRGCSPASEGCAHCWAAAEAHMREKHPNAAIRGRALGLTAEGGGWTGVVRFDARALDLPERVQRPTAWAVWTDLFHESLGLAPAAAALHTMARTPWHRYFILTKRAARMAALLDGVAPLENVLLAVTAENQDRARERVPELLRLKGWRLGLSVEPMLGAVDLSEWLASSFPVTDDVEDAPDGAEVDGCERVGMTWERRSSISWVVAGAETGGGARPCNPDWLRSLRDQCADAGVPFWLKQTDKQRARELDGRVHDGWPWGPGA